MVLASPLSIESAVVLAFWGVDKVDVAEVEDGFGFREDGDLEVELFLALVLLGDFELDFLDGRGEFDGLIELNNSLA